MVASSTGLSSRTAAALAYSGWWITGGLFWLIERQDAFVRRHAAQAVVVFGSVALLIAFFGVLAVASLTFLPAAFGALLIAAGAAWLLGVVLWGWAMWTAINGDEWSIPVADDLAQRLLD